MPVLGVKMQRRLSAEGVVIDESFEEQRRNSLSPSPRRQLDGHFQFIARRSFRAPQPFSDNERSVTAGTVFLPRSTKFTLPPRASRTTTFSL